MRVTLLNAQERSKRIQLIVNALKESKDAIVNKEDLILYIMEKYNCMRRTALEYYKVAELRFKNDQTR